MTAATSTTFTDPPMVGSTFTTIANDAEDGFKTIIALSRVSIDDKAVMKIFGRIQKQALVYWDTIKDSSIMATNGYIISGEAIDFCTQLEKLDPFDANSKEIVKELILDLKESAQKYLASCKGAKVRFARIVKGFAKILIDAQVKIGTEIFSEFNVKDLFSGRVREVKLSDLRNDVAAKLLELGKAIKRLCIWWMSMARALTSVVTACVSMKVSLAMHNKVAKMRGHWINIQCDFDLYNRNIVNLQHTYPRETLVHGPEPKPAASPEIGSTPTALVSSASGSLSLPTMASTPSCPRETLVHDSEPEPAASPEFGSIPATLVSSANGSLNLTMMASVPSPCETLVHGPEPKLAAFPEIDSTLMAPVSSTNGSLSLTTVASTPSSPANNSDEPTFINPPLVGSTLTTIANDAEGGFKVIMALSTVSIDDKAVMKIFGRIQEQVLVYWDTIKDSSVTAKEGYITSGKVIDFCMQLSDLDPLDANSKAIIEEFVEDLKKSVQKCLDSCKEARVKFSHLVQGFAKISRDVQEKIETDVTSEFIVKGVFSGCPREVNLSELGNELRGVAMKLLELSEAIKKLAGWWTGLTTALMLEVVASNKVKVSLAMRSKVTAIQGRWKTIQYDFDQYNRDITNLRSTYPREALIAPNSEGTQAA